MRPRHHLITWLAFAGLLLGGVRSPLQAQRPQTRAGLYFGADAGFGSLGLSGHDDRNGGSTGGIRFGTTLSPHFLIGIETNGWRKTADGPDLETGLLAAVASYYPVVACGFHLKGGAGTAGIESEGGAFGDETEHGLAVVGGAAFDLRVAKNVSLTPTAQYVWASFDPGHTNNLQVMVGLTVH